MLWSTQEISAAFITEILCVMCWEVDQVRMFMASPGSNIG